MTAQNWKITGLRNGNMHVEAEWHIQIFIQQGIANVYKQGIHQLETDVSYMSFAELDRWIDNLISKELN